MQHKLRVLYYCLKLLLIKITQMEYKQRFLNFDIYLMIIKLKSRIFFVHQRRRQIYFINRNNKFQISKIVKNKYWYYFYANQ
ncbi:unnamed protein product [Paramecium sonneborni]|uniref:Uncharacterized protein n=1 Tax=Paramecium sonneborni TaxID=65129 RepID=A0A8S1RPX6_9CILI|nr:unnamed protein product [Paramecium sonneborni]